MEQIFNFPRSSSEALAFPKKFLENRFTELGEISDGADTGEGNQEEGTVTVDGVGGKS